MGMYNINFFLTKSNFLSLRNAAMQQHMVKEGECLDSIALDHGFADWRTIYDHPKNTDLRSKRPDPNVIHPGDKLFIPDK